MTGGSSKAAPARGFSVPSPEAERRKAERVSQIERAKSPNGAVLRYLREVRLRMPLIEATCVMPSEEGSPKLEGMLIALASESFTGKSFAMAQVEADPRFRRRVEDGTTVIPLLVINAPSPCTLLTLGHEALNQLGWVGAYPDRLHKVWHAVRKLLVSRGVIALMINEFHNCIVGRTSLEKQQLAQALKGLLVGDVIVRARGGSEEARIINGPSERFPVFIFAGGTDVIREITDDMRNDLILETARRSVTLTFPEIPCERGSDGRVVYKGMPAFLKTLQVEMGFEPDPKMVDYPMQRRHYKAGSRYFGRIACIVKKAAILSVLHGSRKPLVDYLADAFAELYSLPSSKNPYLVADVDDIAFPPSPNKNVGDKAAPRVVDAK